MRLLVRFLGVLSVLAVFAIAPAEAQTSDADQAAIRQVIQSQMAAIRRMTGRPPTAMRRPPSRRIHQSSGLPGDGEDGLSRRLPSREVEFRDLKVENGRLLQEVYVVGPDGKPALAVYEMQRQPDGSWRINGCWLTSAPDQTSDAFPLRSTRGLG